MAAQKTGREMPTREKPISVRSSRVSFLIAEMMPVGMPMIHATNADVIASLTVFGNAVMISWVTGRFNLYECPRSP